MTSAFENDLNKAEQTLKERDTTIAVVKKGKILFYTGIQGLKAIFKAADQLEDELKGAAVADKIVGKAAALLYAYFNVSSVFGALMSQEAVKVFRDQGIIFRFDRVVPLIKGKKGGDICPFEKKVLVTSKPEEGFNLIHGMVYGRKGDILS